MKKIIAILLALILVLCLAVPALAVTPALPIPDMPEIPDISDDIDFGINFGGVIGDWIEEHPMPPMLPIEFTEPTVPPIGIVRPTEPPAPHEQMGEMVMEDIPARRGWMDWLLDWCWRMPGARR